MFEGLEPLEPLEPLEAPPEEAPLDGLVGAICWCAKVVKMSEN
jgi:hypothetical protein